MSYYGASVLGIDPWSVLLVVVGGVAMLFVGYLLFDAFRGWGERRRRHRPWPARIE